MCAFPFPPPSSQPLLSKDERVTGAKDGNFEATAASLSGRALNFPRLNRSSAAVVVFPLFTSVCTQDAKSQRRPFLPSLRIYDGVIAGSLTATSREPKLLEELKFLLDELPQRPPALEIYVSEIISFSFGDQTFYTAVFSRGERGERQNLMIYSFGI